MNNNNKLGGITLAFATQDVMHYIDIYCMLEEI